MKDCQLFVKQVNPRQYVAQIPQVSFPSEFKTIVCFVVLCTMTYVGIFVCPSVTKH